jgi:hypothetical protein
MINNVTDLPLNSALASSITNLGLKPIYLGPDRSSAVDWDSKIIGKFTILGKIGEGGQGIIHRVRSSGNKNLIRPF